MPDVTEEQAHSSVALNFASFRKRSYCKSYSSHDFRVSQYCYFSLNFYSHVLCDKKSSRLWKNSQATGNETAAVENNWANQRALTAARDFDDHYPGGEGISYQCFLWNSRILRGTPAIRRLPRHHDERFHYPSAEGISNQRFLWNDRILGGTPAIRRLPRHNDERFH